MKENGNRMIASGAQLGTWTLGCKELICCEYKECRPGAGENCAWGNHEKKEIVSRTQRGTTESKEECYGELQTTGESTELYKCISRHIKTNPVGSQK